MSVKKVLQPKGTRKLLALDGGGIRGMVAIAVLAELEEKLKVGLGRSGDSEFRLSDYFDYIGGTSTGAILAACLARGMSVQEIKAFYEESGKKMFDPARLLKRFNYKYENEALENKLKAEFKESDGKPSTLGCPSMKTLLMMVMRNATTDSPWPISNNPAAHYNNPNRPDCNLDIPLWQLVRASTAAPTFFPPEVVKLKEGRSFVFVDGGITSFNNPAFQLFTMATAEPYKLEWPTGEDKMLLVSIGTGNTANANKNLKPRDMNLIYSATSIPSALMFAAQNQQDFLCRMFGKCLVGGSLDREVKDMIGNQSPLKEKLFTYLRYDADISEEGLENLKLPNDVKASDVQQMDAVDQLDNLWRIGEAVAKRDFKIDHYSDFLN